MNLSTIERFTNYIGEPTENGCWPWIGPRQHSGHGRFTICRYNNEGAHRISWSLINGPIPFNLHVLHSCDNGWCVNPEHLHLGTHQDNMREKMERNRNVAPPILKGEAHPMSKLTQEQVDDIKKKLALIDKPYGKIKKIADEYGVCVSTISLIYKKKHWK